MIFYLKNSVIKVMNITRDLLHNAISKYYHLIDSLSFISNDDIEHVVKAGVYISNEKYSNKIDMKMEPARHSSLKNYNKYKPIIVLLTMHILHKNRLLIENTHAYYIHQEVEEFMNGFDYIPTSSVIYNININNKGGMNSYDMKKIINNLCPEVHFDTDYISYKLGFEVYCINIINRMKYIEISNNKYSAFRFSVPGNDGTHCNIFLYDKQVNMWYRIEPAGSKWYCETKDYDEIYKGKTVFSKDLNMAAREVYNELDQHIRKNKANYLSQNDYYFLPGLHTINPGPYCCYYSIMILEAYINEQNIFQAVEVITCRNYVEKKLGEYEDILVTC